MMDSEAASRGLGAERQKQGNIQLMKQQCEQHLTAHCAADPGLIDVCASIMADTLSNELKAPLEATTVRDGGMPLSTTQRYWYYTAVEVNCPTSQQRNSLIRAHDVDMASCLLPHRS